jgi:hypothetical protein
MRCHDNKTDEKQVMEDKEKGFRFGSQINDG